MRVNVRVRPKERNLRSNGPLHDGERAVFAVAGGENELEIRRVVLGRIRLEFLGEKRRLADRRHAARTDVQQGIRHVEAVRRDRLLLLYERSG